MLSNSSLFPCPCCGYRVFARQPGSNERCPVCLWEDDLAQLRFPRMPGSANGVSLEQAQHNFVEFGTAKRRYRGGGREPFDMELRDAAWRMSIPNATMLRSRSVASTTAKVTHLRIQRCSIIGVRRTGDAWPAERTKKYCLQPWLKFRQIRYRPPFPQPACRLTLMRINVSSIVL